ncbi:Copia protein, partial [Dufourea novaeangliae]
QNEGIQRRLTVPHTPKQNGVAERKNRTLVQTARSMLLKAELTHEFWAEAIMTANYLRNRCPTKTLESKTPFEFWNNRRPIFNHLKVFRMKAYVLNKDPNKPKCTQRTKVETFIGYSESSKAYRVWIPNERRVIVYRDIRVIEREGYKSDKCMDQKIIQTPEPCKEPDICIGNNVERQEDRE